jgi:hypothetical protein
MAVNGGSIYERRKKLAEELKILSKDQYEEVYRIIKRAGAPYSENSNGIFFDLNVVTDEVADQLAHFIQLVRIQEADEKRRLDDLAYYRTVKDEEEAAEAAGK